MLPNTKKIALISTVSLLFFPFKEFNECKEKLVENIDGLMKEHPSFSTAKLAQKCFPNKSKCNEYHGNGKGNVVLTLRDLNQQVTKETISNFDQFKYQVKAMGDRLNAFVKPDILKEAKSLTKKLITAANDLKPVPIKTTTAKNAKSSTTATPKVGRRGRSGQESSESNESNKENKEATNEKENKVIDVPKKKNEGRRGTRLKKTEMEEGPENEDLDKLSLELTKDIPIPEPPKEEPKIEPVKDEPKKEPPKKGKGRGRGRGKENETKDEKDGDTKIDVEEDEKVVLTSSEKVEEVKTEPIVKDEKQMANATTEITPKPATKAGKGKRKAPEKSKGESSTVNAKKVKENEIELPNTLVEKTITQNKKVTKRQNKKAVPVISAMPNKVSGVSLLGKGMPQLPTTPLPISLKKTVVGNVIPTKINMPTIQPGGKVVNIASLLPTSPNPRITSPSQIKPGTQQLIQIRPGNLQLQTQGQSMTGSNLVQIRPPSSVINAISNTTLRPQLQPGGVGNAGSIIGAPGGPQFFKIIGGKPVQLSGAASASLANSTSTKLTVPTISGPTSSAAGQGPRIVYVRKGPGGNAIPVGGNGTSLPLTSTTTTSAASPSKAQNKIILVSNKNQSTGGNLGAKVQGAQGVVKLVGGTAGNVLSPGGTQLAPGILSSLRPVAVTSSGVGVKGSNSGPVLLRTVMPKPQAGVFQKTIQPNPSIIGVVPQLPNVPIPKSKLNDKNTKTSGSGSGTKMSLAPTATSVAQLLPKRPIPPQKVSIGGSGNGPPPPKIFKRIISGPTSTTGNLVLPSSGSLILPSNMIPSPPNSQPLSLKQPQQQVTTISGPFVWKNSSQTNFKLSSRINFASFAKFKESQVAAEAAAAAAAGSNKKDSGKKGKGKTNTESLANSEEIHFTLATIVTDDKSNEFTFRLNLKNDPKDPKKSSTFLELEARSKKPHNDHKWNLKVKTNPERYLVSGGCFKTDDGVNVGNAIKGKNAVKSVNETCAFRIPKEISDLKFVDYELQIDKVLVLQQAHPNLSPSSPSKAVIITSSANKVTSPKKPVVAAK